MDGSQAITQNLFATIAVKYIQSNTKQRQATRKAKWLNELAAEYNLNVMLHR